MSDVKLTNDQEKADWLQCLLAASGVYQEPAWPGLTEEEKLRARLAEAARHADILFVEEYGRRCR